MENIKKYEIIKRKEEFNSIIKNSPFIKNKYFIIYIRKKESSYSCFGLAISKKVGNAVTRNKLKRQLRVMISQNKDIISKDCDYIIMIRKDCVTTSFNKLEKKLIELIKEKK